MFIENKYKSWYDCIILRSKNRKIIGYKEKHHIIPRSLGGNNSPSNIANLTAREHYVCHLLLTKFTIGTHRQKMFYALHRMCNKNQTFIKSSVIYEFMRINHAKAVSNRCKGKKIQDLYGRPFLHSISDYQRQRIRESNSSRVWSLESRKKLSCSQRLRKIERPESFNPGKPKSTQHIENISTSKINKFRKEDKTVYQWTHDVYGEFTGTRTFLRDSFPDQNLKVAELSKVVSPLYKEKSYKGWKLI